jgi:RES domain-containing protein
MLVYRISQTKYASSLETPGFAARWNSEGQKMIYTAGSVALACLENLVHRSGTKLNLGNFSIATISIPDKLKIEEISLEQLIAISTEWDSVANYPITQKIGNTWLESLGSAVLRIPSAIVPMENNLLLNPYHPEFPKIKILTVTPFRFDTRLKMNLD